MRRPSRLQASALALVLTGAAGCAALRPTSVGVRGGSGDGPRPRGGLPADAPAAGPAAPGRPPSPEPGALPGPRGRPAPVRATRHASERRVCRAGGAPRGWIAVAYVSAAGECPARSGADSAATVAVIVRHAEWPRGAVLEVCADQRVPRAWVVDAQHAPEDPGRCPGAARAGAATTKRLRRVE